MKLGVFGNFQISISSEGAETAEKVSSNLIQGNKITFRPGADFRDMLRTIKYEKTINKLTSSSTRIEHLTEVHPSTY